MATLDDLLNVKAGDSAVPLIRNFLREQMLSVRQQIIFEAGELAFWADGDELEASEARANERAVMVAAKRQHMENLRAKYSNFEARLNALPPETPAPKAK